MIIGFSGPMGAGKSTAARMLTGFERRSFGRPLKQMLVALMRHADISPGEIERRLYGDMKEEIIPVFGVSARRLMQTLGTEWGRDLIDPDIWVKVATAGLTPRSKVVFDDVRFENEAAAIRALKGVVVMITRGGKTLNEHRSEAGVLPDYTIVNAGTMDEMGQALWSLPGLALPPR
jgi:hypothetical protein